MTQCIAIYDTTLRDGAQAEGVSFSLADKLNLTREIDALGIHYIEGGWPGSNPKDLEYFAAVRRLKLKNARIAAFGSTRHAKNSAAEDPNLQQLAAAGAPVATIVGKTWDMAVHEALRVSLDENLAMIHSSVKYLKDRVEEVFFDAEHFFDGYRTNPEYALKALNAAAEAGARTIILCDTNGGGFPHHVAAATSRVVSELAGLGIGIHAHNDGGMAVANSIEAVRAGATQVQGTLNGLGERVGNADLVQIIPNLEAKLHMHCIGADSMRRLTEVSRYVYETANLPPPDKQPFVGRSAFAHKAGLHVSAIVRNPATYEHLSPEVVGNERRVLVSELSGRSNVLALAKVDLSDHPEDSKKVLERLMDLENRGYSFENAEASFDLLVRKTLGSYQSPFKLKSFRVMSESDFNGRRLSEAMVKVEAAGVEYHTVSESEHGPVSALDKALRKALVDVYPVLEGMRLVDYKVHIVNAQAGAAAKVRVVIQSADRSDVWSTVGLSEDIIQASCLALVDSIEYLLSRRSQAATYARSAPAVRGQTVSPGLMPQ